MGKYLRFVLALLATSFIIQSGLAASSSDYKSMIRYDRIWESISMAYPRDIIKYMRFDGTEEINGKTWHRIVTFRKAYPGNVDYETETYSFKFEDGVYDNEGYMREEDGVVYTLIDAYHDEKGNWINNWSGTQYLSSSDTPRFGIVEAPVYNFNCQEGECYDGFSFVEKRTDFATFKNLSTSVVDIDGEQCRQMQIGWVTGFGDEVYGNYPVIEGIGAVDWGCLNYHEFTDHAAHMWYYNYFMRLLDMNGNAIYSSYMGSVYNVPYKEAFSEVETLSEGSRLLTGDGLVAFGEDNHRNVLTLYDMKGQEAANAEGTGRISLQTSSLPSGIYVAVAITDGVVADRRKITVRH